MSTITSQQAWEEYRDSELARVTPVLARHGFELTETQQHIKGERYLMQAVTTTSGHKLILLGIRTRDGARVVIKATSEGGGIHELKHEEACRALLHRLSFAYDVFHSPKNIAVINEDGVYAVIREYVEQEIPFLERPIEEQFMYALRSFKAQEGAHASVYTHLKQIRSVFERYDSGVYVERFDQFMKNILEHLGAAPQLQTLLARARDELVTHSVTLERYGDFLTHTDFVPHNFRIKNNTLYLLDLSSIRFGNKYEGWARFGNFMALYEPKLLEALLQYVRDNRTPEEYVSLRLMRMFRLGEIIWYYIQASEHSDGDLQKLNRARVEFWTSVLSAVLNDTPLSEEVRRRYITTRDSLRSEDEKKRQVGLH